MREAAHAKGVRVVSIGPPELILILIIVLVVFGAGKLPQVFSSLGKGIKEFRDAAEGRDTTEVPTTTATTTTSNPVPPATAAPVTPPPPAQEERRDA